MSERFDMANSEVIYVPVPGNSNCIYPIYVPVVMKEPEVFRSSGRLSAGDYEETKNNLAGFPALLPLIAALAPLVPGVIKGVSKLFKKDDKPKYRNTISNGQLLYHNVGPGGVRKNISNGYYSQRGYHGLQERKSGYPRVAPFNVGGYIPTNPNIKNLKDLQELYDKYE